jgi:hypothetical protein
MLFYIKRLLPLLLVKGLLAGSIEEQFDQIVSTGFGGVEYGATDEHGDYILCVSMLEVSPQSNLTTAVETVRILAQRELAAVMGSEVSGETISESQSRTITIDEKTRTEVIEFFSDISQTETNQFLRGASVYDTRIIGSQIYVGFLLSYKQAQAAANLASFSSGGSNISYAQTEEKRDLKVEALGLAEIRKGDIETARKNAMASARRNAVEHAMGVTVVATGQVKNLDPNSARFKNLSHSLGEVLRSKVLDEGQEGSFYKIKIAALVTAADFSREVGKYMSAIGNPLFYIDRSSGDELGDEFSEFFKDLGFKLTQASNESDFFIRLRSKFLDRKHPLRGSIGTQLQLTIEIIDPNSEKVLLVQKNDPRQSTNFLSDPDRRRQIVAEDALFSMEDSLREKVSKMIADMVQNGREIEVGFRGASKLGNEFSDFILDQLEWVPGASDATKSSSFGSIQFSLRYLGSMELLQSTLQSEIRKKYKTNSVSLVTQKPNLLEFSIR